MVQDARDARPPELGLPRRNPLRSVLFWVGLAITAAFTVLTLRSVHLSDVVDALRESDYVWLLPAAAVLAVGVLLRAVRWRALFTPRSRPPLRETASALLVGLFFNNVLPLRVGEIARVVALNRRCGTSRGEALSTVVVERVYDVFVLLLLLFAVSPLLPDVGWLDAAAVIGAVLAVVLAAAVVVVRRFGSRPIAFVLRPLARVLPVTEQRLEHVAVALDRGLAGLRSAAVALTALGWTVASWLALALSNGLLLLGFDTGLDTADTLLAGLLVLVATNLAMVLPSSPAALGVFEGATVIALSAFGVDESLALSYALVLHALNLVPYVVVGGVLLRRYRV